jgi:DNA-binding MarR family transcriptional regulator
MVDVKYPGGVWRALIDVIHAQKYWMNQISDELGITLQMAHAIHEIPVAGSVTMKELAADMACDASNATGLIDRLETRGLVERRPSERDRRLKCVVLTAAGKRLRRKIEERFNDSPPAIAALSEDDRRTLREILGRVLEHAARQRESEASGRA